MSQAQARGRKNARRVSSLARHQKSLQEAEAFAKVASQKLGVEAFEEQIYFGGKVQRIKKAIANTEAKLMPQDAAEAVRTKKNRQGFSRQR